MIVSLGTKLGVEVIEMSFVSLAGHCRGFGAGDKGRVKISSWGPFFRSVEN